MPNPALVSGTQNNAAIASGTSATVTSTGSVTAGNLLVVVLLVGGATAPSALTAPDATWTTAMATIATASGGTIVAAIFTKQVTVTGAFSGAFTWTTTATSGHWALTEWSTSQGALVVLDGAVSRTQNASGTNTSPSVTPGGSNTLDTLICCSFGGVVGVDALTIPAGMTAITSMATAGTASIPFFYGASLALASAAATGAKTWTIPTSQTNLGVSLLLQSQPLWGFETQTQLPIRNQLTAAPRARAVRQTPGFAFFGDLGRTSWPLDQPPVPRPGGGLARVRQRIAAITEDRDDGNEFPLVLPTVPAVGWGAQPPQPLNRSMALRQRAAAITEDRDDGNYLPRPPSLTFAFDQPLQPLRQAPRFKSPEIGDGGIAFPFVPPPSPVPWFEQIRSQEPYPKRTMSALAFRTGIPQFPPWVNVGFEQTASQDPHHWRKSPEVGDAGIVFPFTFVPSAVVPWFETSPPLVRHALFRSPEPGDAGIASPYVRFTALDWPWLPTYRHPRPERSAAISRGDEGVVAPTSVRAFPFPEGWQVQPPQPPHPRSERSGSIQAGDAGIESPFAFVAPTAFVNWGFEIAPPMLRRPSFKVGGLRQRITLPVPVPWLNFGFDQVLSQDLHRRWKSPEPGDAGIVLPFVFVPPAVTPWFEPIRFQPPFYPKVRQRGPGIEGQSVFAAFQLSPWWDDRMEQIRVRPTKRGAFLRGDDGNQATFTPPTVLPLTSWPEPAMHRRPRPERAGSIQIGEGGIELPFVFVPPVFTPLFEVAPPLLRRPPRTAVALKGRAEFAIFPPWVNLGFDQGFSQDLHRFRKSPEFGDQGTEFPFVFVPPVFTPLFEVPSPHPSRPKRTMAALAFKTGIPQFAPWVNVGFDQTYSQPLHPRRERAGSIQVGEPGIVFPFAFVPPPPIPWFETTPALTRHRFWKSPEFGDQGILSQLARFFPSGWEVQPPQPPHPRSERSGAIMLGEPGIEAQYVFVPPTQFVGWGFEPIPSPQPPHPRRERAGTIMRGAEIESPFVFVAPPTIGWAIQSWQPPHPRPERTAAIMPREDGIQVPIVFRPYGWEIQPPQPPHPRPERAGTVMRGDDGIAQFIAPPAPPFSWEIQAVQPPRLRFERRGAIARGDDGTQSGFVRFFPSGWEIQPVQPPRRYHERRGLFLRGDEGTQARFIRFFPLLQEPTPPLFFRRPLPRVPVFMLDSVEQFGIFVPTVGPSAVCVTIAPYGAATTIGAMELKTIIEAFKATTIIKRQDCT